MATLSGGGGETTGGQPHLAKQDLSTLVRARASEREREGGREKGVGGATQLRHLSMRTFSLRYEESFESSSEEGW